MIIANHHPATVVKSGYLAPFANFVPLSQLSRDPYAWFYRPSHAPSAIASSSNPSATFDAILDRFREVDTQADQRAEEMKAQLQMDLAKIGRYRESDDDSSLGYYCTTTPSSLGEASAGLLSADLQRTGSDSGRTDGTADTQTYEDASEHQSSAVGHSYTSQGGGNDDLHDAKQSWADDNPPPTQAAPGQDRTTNPSSDPKSVLGNFCSYLQSGYTWISQHPYTAVTGLAIATAATVAATAYSSYCPSGFASGWQSQLAGYLPSGAVLTGEGGTTAAMRSAAGTAQGVARSAWDTAASYWR